MVSSTLPKNERKITIHHFLKKRYCLFCRPSADWLVSPTHNTERLKFTCILTPIWQYIELSGSCITSFISKKNPMIDWNFKTVILWPLKDNKGIRSWKYAELSCLSCLPGKSKQTASNGCTNGGVYKDITIWIKHKLSILYCLWCTLITTFFRATIWWFIDLNWKRLIKKTTTTCMRTEK